MQMLLAISNENSNRLFATTTLAHQGMPLGLGDCMSCLLPKLDRVSTTPQQLWDFRLLMLLAHKLVFGPNVLTPHAVFTLKNSAVIQI